MVNEREPLKRGTRKPDTNIDQEPEEAELTPTEHEQEHGTRAARSAFGRLSLNTVFTPPDNTNELCDILFDRSQSATVSSLTQWLNQHGSSLNHTQQAAALLI